MIQSLGFRLKVYIGLSRDYAGDSVCRRNSGKSNGSWDVGFSGL